MQLRFAIAAALAVCLMGTAPARAQGQGAALQALIAQVQRQVFQLDTLLKPVPPLLPFNVDQVVTPARALLAQARNALVRAINGANQAASIAELNALTFPLNDAVRRLQTLPTLIRDSAFLDRLIIDAQRELDGARQVLADTPSSRAETLFAQAQSALASAQQFRRSQQLIQSRVFAERSIQLSKDLAKLSFDRDDLRRRIERALREIDRLADLCPPSPKAPLRVVLAEADRAARRAREAYLTDQIDEVVTHLLYAEDELRIARKKARGLHGGAGDPERTRADQRLKASRDTIKEAQASLGISPPPLASRIVAEAKAYQRRAEEFFDKEVYDSAAANAHLAQRLAARAFNMQR